MPLRHYHRKLDAGFVALPQMTGRRFGMPFILSPPTLTLRFRQNNGSTPSGDYQPSRSLSMAGSVSVVLVILICVYLYLEGGKIARHTQFEGFLAQKATPIFVFLGIGIFLRFFLIQKNKEKYFFISESIIVAATIGLMIEVMHIQESFAEHNDINYEDISGEWIYKVANEHGYITHGGISSIKVVSKEIYIDGYRKYINNGMEKAGSSYNIIPNDGNYWASDVAVMTGERIKKIHFIYSILVKGDTNSSPPKTVRGYCVLSPKKVNTNDGSHAVITRLVGHYTHLAPGTLSGNIVFKRKEKKDALKYINKLVKNSKI